jgi:hypothetical protein
VPVTRSQPPARQKALAKAFAISPVWGVVSGALACWATLSSAAHPASLPGGNAAWPSNAPVICWLVAAWT